MNPEAATFDQCQKAYNNLGGDGALTTLAPSCAVNNVAQLNFNKWVKSRLLPKMAAAGSPCSCHGSAAAARSRPTAQSASTWVLVHETSL